MTVTRILAGAALALATLTGGCASLDPAPLDGDGVFAVPGDDASHHRLRYRDGQVSLNDSCAIKLGNRLNARVPPLYVNGQPVGFC